jgi:transcriptional regulator with XRE-family HTH domain
MVTPAELLEPILVAARRNGMDQSERAKAAGLSPESISRAKRRASMDLATLDSLADAAGLQISIVPKRTEPQHACSESSKGLADPAWGLAWSNPAGITDTALIRAALRRGNFTAVLEACAIHGLERVKAEWNDMTDHSEQDPSRALSAQINRILRNIQRGLDHAPT